MQLYKIHIFDIVLSIHGNQVKGYGFITTFM